MSITISKAQKKVLAQVEKLGDSFASAGMVSNDLGLKIKTVKSHLSALEHKGVVSSKDCHFHENTKVYALTQDAIFWGLAK